MKGSNWTISEADTLNVTQDNSTEFMEACVCEFCRHDEEELCKDQPDDYSWCGKGGFMPYGVDGVIKGAASAFYGFVGFDVIATMGEEVINPQKMMPVAIILSLTIIFLAYFSLSAVVTLMLPYFLQDALAPIPYIFEYVGWEGAAWTVRGGALLGLTARYVHNLSIPPSIDCLILMHLVYWEA